MAEERRCSLLSSLVCGGGGRNGEILAAAAALATLPAATAPRRALPSIKTHIRCETEIVDIGVG